MKYFFDNCISWRLAKMLCALEVEAEALRDSFEPSIDDVTLFQQLAGSGKVFVSNDTRQTRKPVEVKALKNSGVTALFFGPFWSNLQFWHQAVWLVRKWPIIDGFVKGAMPGTCAEIKQNGKAQVFHP